MKTLNVEQLRFLELGPYDFQLHAGQCTGLSGPSGCGKSQLLRCLADLEPHQGKINLDAVEQQSVPAHEWRKKVALLPAESQWWYDSVAEHFETLEQNALERLGFQSEVGRWSIMRMSSGEKQRLGLLRLLQNQPQVLLLDEPTANLDQDNTRLFEEFVMEYLQLHQATCIWVSHDADQLKRIAQHHFVFQSGELNHVD